MTDQNTEFEAIKRRHETCQGVLAEDFGEHCHTDRATLITLVEAERARADKAEAELDAEQVAHLKTRARLTEAEAELAEAKQAALATFRTWLAENGMVVVPREATSSMVMHASLVEIDDIELTPSEYQAAWQAMLAAAPVTGLE